MINWKLIAGSAVFAFLLSFFIGVISGVSFGIVFLRAVVGGLVFGGLAHGAAFIIQKYLPELAKTMSLGAGETESAGGVDIVIEDESPYAGAQEASGQSGTGAEPEGSGQAGAVGERSGVPAGFEETGGTETEGEAEEAEEVEEVEDTLEQPSGYTGTGGPEEESEQNGTEFVEEVEELSNTSSSEETADVEEVEEVEPTGADQNATIDSLPDIDSLSDSFAVTGEEGEESSGTSSSDSSIGTIDVAGEQEDPRNIAKAVQTMMKKE